MRVHVAVLLTISASMSAWDLAVAEAAVAPVAGESAATGEQGEGLQTVTVTAERREENQQRVPIAISSFTAEQLQQTGIINTLNLQQITPGLVFNHVVNAGLPFLRGVGSYNAQAGDEGAIALYVDGVYIASQFANIFDFNNVDRIEVLKGPQGTLFGRNATGGVIQVITRDPSHSPYAEAEVGYGNYQTVDTRFYGTAGITDNLAADLAFNWHDQMQGFGRNTNLGIEVNYRRNIGARTKWLFTPDDLTRITLSLDFNRLVDTYGAQGTPAPGSVGLDGDVYDGFFNTRSDLGSTSWAEQYGASLKIDHKFSGARFVSITSWRDYPGENKVDQDGGPLIFGTSPVETEQHTFTQEFQLLSPEASRVSWVAGLYYLYDNTAYNPLSINIGAQAITVPVTVPGLSEPVNAPIAVVTFPPITLDIYGRQRTKSYSGFVQSTFELFSNTHFTGGARFTEDQKTENGQESFNPAPEIFQSATFKKWTWKASLDHQFTPNVMGYLSASRGFKSGLFNLVSPYNPPVKPEVLDDYELGLKSEFLEHRIRLNAAAFYYDFSDLQLQQIVLGTTQLFNAASARIKGVEADIAAVPVTDLTLTAGLAFLDAHFSQFDNAPLYVANPLPNPLGGPAGYVTTSGSAAGNVMPNAPKSNVNASANYLLHTRSGELLFAANASYISRVFQIDNKFSVPGYTLVNASIQWTAPNNRWHIRAWGANLLDKRYVTSYAPGFVPCSIDQAPGDPRTYQVLVGVRF